MPPRVILTLGGIFFDTHPTSLIVFYNIYMYYIRTINIKNLLPLQSYDLCISLKSSFCRSERRT